ncbi:MAG: VPLPA-CTERM sorting domain-containing protein [Rhodobacteraceae bacterium]|nr:MAG: VPLPA-CTERM sorting domain-containing protein [Paracoccaceae bacterium]
MAFAALAAAFAPPLAAAEGRVDVIARTGTPAPGVPGAAFSGFFGAGGPPSLNDAGQVAYNAVLQGPGVTPGVNDRGFWVDQILRARLGDPAPGFAGATFSSFAGPALNGSGDVAFFAFLIGAPPTADQGIFLNDTVVARRGDPGRPFSVGFVGAPAINAAGDVAYVGAAEPGAWSIWRGDERIIGSGDTPTGAAQPLAAFARPTAVSVNDAGRVAYRSSVGALVDEGLFIDDRLVVRRGDVAPGVGPGVVFGSFFNPAIDETGALAFRAFLQGDVGSANDIGIWRGDRLVARRGDAPPGAPGETLAGLSDPALAPGGQVAFDAITAAGRRGLWLVGPNGDTLTVVRDGDVIGGRTVDLLTLGGAGATGINAFSQVAYVVRFTDGEESVLRFTPDLRWIAGASGSWDDAMGWTIAQRPGPVHDVTIAPDVAATVTGPTDAAAVRRLTVGGGAGRATLDLAGGEIASTQRVTVEANGRVSGGGVLDAAIVTNFGGVSVGRGETMRATASLESVGDIDVIGGRLELGGQLFNAGGGSVLGVDAEIAAPSILNQGRMQFIGETTVTGFVRNTGAITTVAGLTTYDGGVVNDGVITTGFGDVSRFLGAVSGSGTFAGPGKVEVLGALSPGASFGLLDFEGDLFLGPDSVTIMQIGGTARGVSYDAIDVGGTLTLGGLLQVVLLDGFTPRDGERFSLFNAMAFGGAFDALDLPEGVFLTDLYDGGLGVAPVPLPASAWLLGSAVVGLGVWRRRRDVALARRTA